MKSFVLKLFVVTAVIALIGWLSFSLFLAEYYLPVFPFLLLFFFITTIFIHAYQLKLSQKDMGKFARSSMLVIFFKLVLYSVAAIVYIAIHSENAIPFVICLFILYLIYNFMEVTEITRMVTKNRKNNTENSK
jgi:hypothetical protein